MRALGFVLVALTGLGCAGPPVCGAESKANVAEGTCEPIPGLAEGRAAMQRAHALLLISLHETIRFRGEIAPDAVDCILSVESTARWLCTEKRFLPYRSLPEGISRAECEEIWLRGTQGWNIPNLKRPFEGLIARECHAEADLIVKQMRAVWDE